jgi:hypothetical protein
VRALAPLTSLPAPVSAILGIAEIQLATVDWDASGPLMVEAETVRVVVNLTALAAGPRVDPEMGPVGAAPARSEVVVVGAEDSEAGNYPPASAMQSEVVLGIGTCVDPVVRLLRTKEDVTVIAAATVGGSEEGCETVLAAGEASEADARFAENTAAS